MESEYGVNPIQGSFFDHRLGAARKKLFRRLKEEHDLAFELTPSVFEKLGDSQQNSHMSVVAAGVGGSGV